MLFEISFDYDSKLDTLDERIKVAVVEKLTSLTQIMYNKVRENLSGFVLNKVSGQLYDSVRQEVSSSGESDFGTVFMEPASPKAWALEKGGNGYYPIVPTKASLLRFFSKQEGQIVFRKEVNHPPSKAFGYLRLAFEEMQELVPEGFEQAINEVLKK